MTFLLKTQVVFSLLLLFLLRSCLSDVQQHPQSVNTVVNSTVSFTCSGTSGTTSITWAVNNVAAQPSNTNYVVPDVTDNPSRFQILKATPALNGSTIYCIAFYPSFDTSNTALLLLQGILAPPGNLNATVTNTTLTVSWTPPYTLPNVPILGYNVSLVDLDTGDVVIDQYYHNQTTNGSFAMPSEQLCHRVELLAMNALGQGEIATRLILHSRVISKDDVNYTVKAISSMVHITVITQIWYTCLSLHSTADISLYSELSDKNHYTETVNITGDHSSVVTNFADVEPNQYYLMNIVLYNSATGWNSSASGIANISSFDTKSIEVNHSSTEGFCLRCHFITGSLARGCLIHLHGNSSAAPLRNITSLKESEEDMSEWSCYYQTQGPTVPSLAVAYDIEQDGNISSNSAAVLAIDHHEFPPAVSSVNSVTTISTSLVTDSKAPTALQSTASRITSIHSTVTSSEATALQSSSTAASSSGFNTTVPTNFGSSATGSSGLILPVLAVVIVTSVVLVLCLMSVIAILIVTLRKKKGRIRILQRAIVPTTPNPIYDMGSSAAGDDYRKEKLADLGNSTLPNVTASSHIYSEVKGTASNEWVPNPTYGQAGADQTSAGNGTQEADGFKIYDSPKHLPFEIADLNPCPAYEQPPMLPKARRAKTNE